MDLSKYYLNLDRLSGMKDDEKNRIHEYYRDMLYSYQDKREMIGQSLFNTLWFSGYLVDIRKEKLDEILK